MKKKKNKPKRRSIEAAGGIVMRGRLRPLFAVVQLSRQRSWVLPKGKLNRGETALAAARREAIEETGHDVEVHEFLGSLSYVSAGRPKTVRFWRMQASSRPVAKLMRDVRAVRWLPLSQATAQLTHEREKDFLEKVGRQAVRRISSEKRRQPKHRQSVPAKKVRQSATASPGNAVRQNIKSLRPQRDGSAGLPKGPLVPPMVTVTAGRRPPALIRKLWTLLRRQGFGVHAGFK
ncbi:MAG: NUDIX hydrolase [Pseudomonadota bacterium]|jgi:8-oxo-dGTP diphosphatase